MKKFEIKKTNAELKKVNEIRQGASVDQDGYDAELIASFDTADEAKEELKKYSTKVDEMSGYYSMTEYYIEESEYDEDGDWVNGGDILEFSELKIDVIEKPSYESIGIFSNIEDAKKAADACENETFFSFN